LVENSQIGQRVDDVVSLAYWNPGGRIYGRRGTVLPLIRIRTITAFQCRTKTNVVSLGTLGRA